jgi:hypothetical protein
MGNESEGMAEASSRGNRPTLAKRPAQKGKAPGCVLEVTKHPLERSPAYSTALRSRKMDTRNGVTCLELSETVPELDERATEQAPTASDRQGGWLKKQTPWVMPRIG